MKKRVNDIVVEPEKNECNNRAKCCRCYMRYSIIILGLIICSSILRDGLINVQKNRDIISVKGLAEKIVQADSAVWTIPINATGDEFDLVKADIDSKTLRIIEFLKKYGLKDDEIHQDMMRLFDKTAQKYYDENNKSKRFSIDHQLIVKSDNVVAVKESSANINELLKDGITTSYDGYSIPSAPNYLFTKLNEIKPAMLSEAMQEARKVADEMIKDSGAKIYGIKGAKQGTFSIYSREAVASSNAIDQRVAYSPIGQYSTNEAYFIDKVVRIVAGVDYYIEKK